MTEQPIDITPAQRKLILDLLARHLPNTTAWAYGSRVTWKARPQSDLDMVVFAEPVQALAVANLKEALEESDLPFRVDLFVWHEVPEQFRKNIEAEHVVLVERQVHKVPEGWKLTTVGDFCPFFYGKSLPEKKRENGQYQVYGSNGPVGFHSIPLVEEPGVIIGRKGSIGAVHFSQSPFWPIDTTFFITGSKQNDLKFTYYSLISLGLNHMNADSAVPGLNRDAAHLRSVIVPELAEQRAIAHILGSLDDKIALNRNINANLEGMAQALFKSWFVDFDPVIDKALAAGNSIPEPLQARAAKRAALGDKRKAWPKDVEDLFPDSFECTEEMGWIPKGWEETYVGDILELAYGKALAAKVREAGPYPVYGSGGINGTHKDALVEGPGIIVGRKGTVGSVFWEQSNFFPIDTVFFVKLLKDIPLYWVYQNLLQMDIASLGADSAVPGVNRNAVYAKRWLFPGKTILDAYWAQLIPFINKQQLLFSHNSLLGATRDTLLPKLLSGELRVPDVDKFMEGL